ncbi:MAG: SGNH/GDSL hydrolase family protein, partial [Aquabacterium sp.]|nr:SGNH/GDSL hydrolase family protein [Aquabacterium sp.]
MKSQPVTHLLSILALAVAGLAAAPAQAYTGLFVIGDSISDSGNEAAATGMFSPLPDGNSFVPSLAYAPYGTFSNGFAWTTQLAGMLGLAADPFYLGGSNFAFGGARVSGADVPTPTLTTQLGYFLGATGGAAPGGALYIVQGGANDARDAALAVGGGADLFTTAGAAGVAYAAGIGNIVDQLQAAGAQHILVVNTPNIGVTPAARAVPGGAGAYAGAVVSGVMNGFLANRMAGEAGVQMFDAYSFLSGAVMNPGAFGFANVTDACGVVGGGVDCDTALFWDGIHPTAKMHGAIAGAVFAQVVPEPATYGLMAMGLLLVGAAARRRAA